MALEGATPTMLGPRPLNKALGPSFWTMCLEALRSRLVIDLWTSLTLSVKDKLNDVNPIYLLHDNVSSTSFAAKNIILQWFQRAGYSKCKGQLINDKRSANIILVRVVNQKIFGEPMAPVQIRLTRVSRDDQWAHLISYLLTHTW